MLIDRSQVTAESPEFIHNRVDMQSRYMEDIWDKFDGMVRPTVPLDETQVRGTSSLTRMGKPLFI
jgi:hypothetical protein